MTHLRRIKATNVRAKRRRNTIYIDPSSGEPLTVIDIHNPKEISALRAGRWVRHTAKGNEPKTASNE